MQRRLFTVMRDGAVLEHSPFMENSRTIFVDVYISPSFIRKHGGAVAKWRIKMKPPKPPVSPIRDTEIRP